MDEKKSPPRLPTGKAGLGNASRSNVIAFPGKHATCCEICRVPRRPGDKWRRLCFQCAYWNELGQALNAFSRFLREGK